MTIDIPAEEKKWLLKMTMASEDLNITSESEWEAMVDHIAVHKYFINEELPFTVNWGEAVFSWYENVYKPLRMALDGSRGTRVKAAGYSAANLVFAVSSHWYYLKESDPDITAENAVGHYLSNLKGGTYAQSA